MTVVNPKSISGINSITTGSGSDNLLTIHTSDASSTERVRINSSGDVIVGSGITVSPDGDIFATGVTTSTTFSGNFSGGTVAGSTGTFTGDVDIADKIVHTGDTNTAIRFPSADTVSVETGGTQKLSLGSATVFNETGADVDFRIESSGTANMFLLDAGNNRIGLNRPTPLEMFEVGGNIYLSSNSSNANDGNALKFQTKTGGFDTSYGAAIHGLRVGDASSYLRFDTGGQSEKMRLDSSGRLMIGNTNASTMYQDGGDDLVIGNTSGSHGMTIISQDNNVGRIMFSDTYTSGTGTYEGQILYSHALNTLNFYSNYTSNSNLVMTLGGSNGDVTVHGGNVIIGTSGKGIDFSATSDPSSPSQADNEVLSNYEEGTWTPGISGSTGITGHSYSSRNGFYTRIGDRVFCDFSFVLSAKGTISGTYIQIVNLPYAINGSSNTRSCSAPIYYRHLNASWNFLALQQHEGQAKCYIFGVEGSGGASSRSYPDGTDISNITEMTASFSYLAA